MEQSKDLYEILEIDRSSTEEDIKKAYKKKAMKYHPDKKGGNAEKFKEINEAYAILSDANKKQMYDKFGIMEGHDMSENMPNMDNIFENLFGFGFAGMNSRRKKKTMYFHL
jgi:DnaJ-class molecular chaperone